MLLVMFIPFVSFSQRNDKKKSDEEMLVEAQPVFTEGVIYSLPRTGLLIKVETKSTTFVPGPYAAYAEKYLGIKNVNTTASTKWSISAISLTTFSEPDPNAVYKAMNEIAAQVSLTEDGIIAGIRLKGENKPSKVIGYDAITSQANPSPFTDLSSSEYYFTEIDATNGTETMRYKSTEEKAREAADYLIRLRKKRAFEILSASDVVPEDGKGYEVFIKEAQRLEELYVSLFTGKTISNTNWSTFSYVPDENDVKNEVLFRFSDDKGILPKSDISGKPVMISITKNADFTKTVNQLKKSDNPNAGESGIYYRIPAIADLNVTDGLNVLYNARLSLPQLGTSAPLPEMFLDGSYSISFNPQSGTLLQVEHK